MEFHLQIQTRRYLDFSIFVFFLCLILMLLDLRNSLFSLLVAKGWKLMGIGHEEKQRIALVITK
jgi:hypothetical protein